MNSPNPFIMHHTSTSVSRIFGLLSFAGLWLCASPPPVLARAVVLDSAFRSLKGIPAPVTPGLLDGDRPIVVDQAAALQLGKALFWDMNLGSDGVACATCHFHAGADRRFRNQLDTGVRHEKSPTGITFEKTASGAAGGPNYTLKSGDFPMYRLEDPIDKKSKVLFSTDDVVSSSGAFFGELQSVKSEGDGNDVCKSLPDPIFHAGSGNTRRVATRNAPSVINAAFSYRGFWDGRANNLFNGETAFGPRDKESGVWEIIDGKPVKTHPLLKNAALASQAVAPPLDMKEMSCTLRSFPLIGRKLLKRRPLEFQDIHPEDSVLGAVRDPSGKGLAATYGDLIRKSFAPRYWSGAGDFGRPVGDGEPWSQAEANFAFFLGLAIQLYEDTLISDDSPFDSPRDAQGYPSAFNERQRRGHDLFQTEVCHICHTGPNLSLASLPELMDLNSSRPPRLVDRRVLNGDFDGFGVVQALVDVGFANTSVVPTAHDIGVGGKDPYGNPLSFTEQYVNSLLDPKHAMVDPIRVLPCTFTFPFVNDYKAKELQKQTTEVPECGNRAPNNPVPTPATVAAELKKHEQGRMLAAIKGAFKIPSLRNVELTGPYMHNGGMKSLEEVVDFYDRGGNAANTHHFATGVFTHGFTPQQKADLVAFLKGLTDERVRWERAPFDHPSLSVPHGHGEGASPRDPRYAPDDLIQVPAVGKSGRDAESGPLKEFQSFLPN
jgi:cytochrome c peroxidase